MKYQCTKYTFIGGEIMRRVICLLVLVGIFLINGCLTSPKKRAVNYLEATKDDYIQKVEIDHEPFEPRIKFSTYWAFKEDSILSPDPQIFSRGYIHRETRVKTYQVYAVLRYRGPRWAYYNTVSYKIFGSYKDKKCPECSDDAKFKIVELVSVERDVVSCYARSGNCTYEEHVLFYLSEEEMKSIHNGYKKVDVSSYENTRDMRNTARANALVAVFRSNKRGPIKGAIMFSELAALYEVMQNYK